MALRWNMGKCPGYIALKEKHGEAEHEDWVIFNMTAQALASVMMFCQFPEDSDWEITEDNWRAVFTRINMYERACGASRGMPGGKDLFFTPGEIHDDFMGFSVNVGNQSTRKFHTRITNVLMDETRGELRRYDNGKKANT